MHICSMFTFVWLENRLKDVTANMGKVPSKNCYTATLWSFGSTTLQTENKRAGLGLFERVTDASRVVSKKVQKVLKTRSYCNWQPTKYMTD